MEDADFDVTFGPNVYLAKQISRNLFAFKGPTGRVFYMRKKKRQMDFNRSSWLLFS